MSARFRVTSILTVAAVVLGTGCGPGMDVRTMSAPDAGLSSLHRFQMLPGPARRDGRPPTGADDPMISNSIANRAIRDRISNAFQDKGYILDNMTPEFGVAFYATTRHKLDITNWDYGYPYYPRWPRYPVPTPVVTEYTEGSVVVDVVKSDTKMLLWRGHATAQLSNDPADNVKQLANAAAAIVAQFPPATKRIVAERP